MFRHLPLWLALLGWPAPVFAHQLDEYVQATLVDVEPAEIRLEINLTPGVAVAGKVLALIDTNHDGTISTNESAAYAELLKRDLVVQFDGRAVKLETVTWNFPELGELRTGWGIIQIEYAITPGMLSSGPHKLTFENRHLPAIGEYLINAAQPRSPAIQITGQKRNENQSTGEITFDFRPPPNASLKIAVIFYVAALFLVLLVAVWQARKKQKAGWGEINSRER